MWRCTHSARWCKRRDFWPVSGFAKQVKTRGQWAEGSHHAHKQDDLREFTRVDALLGGRVICWVNSVRVERSEFCSLGITFRKQLKSGKWQPTYLRGKLGRTRWWQPCPRIVWISETSVGHTRGVKKIRKSKWIWFGWGRRREWFVKKREFQKGLSTTANYIRGGPIFGGSRLRIRRG